MVPSTDENRDPQADRLRVLAQAMRTFAEATTDLRLLLQRVARTVAETVQDSCSVLLLADDPHHTQVLLQPLAMHHCDPEVERAFQRTASAEPLRLSDHIVLKSVIETKQPLVIAKMDLEKARTQTTPVWVEFAVKQGLRSVLIVPLQAQGRVIGILSLARFSPHLPPFDEHDASLAQDLADHAALAISNAQLFESSQRELADRKRAEAALRKTEEQLLQAQKMEAIGRLAGGVAHDFNNLLTAILGYSELAMNDVKEGDRFHREFAEIRKAGQQAADLTRQLLAFSRKQILQPRVLDMNAVISGIGRMLRRLIGGDIELATILSPHLGRVKVDPGQIEQVIVNLVVNARDAMPEGGTLAIETSNVELDETHAKQHPEVVPGAHVLLAVSDTGTGMSEEVKAHLFEPFFTTKPAGKGTGLGLSTVYGIVKQSGGHIGVRSEPGQGTTFKIYFPRVTQTLSLDRPGTVSVGFHKGTETILLVEDNETARGLLTDTLDRCGYSVLSCVDAAEAIARSRDRGQKLHVLLTDIVLPGMSGLDLARRLVQERPSLKVVFMSGATENAALQRAMADPDTPFLQKPITPAALVRKIREVLGAYEP